MLCIPRQGSCFCGCSESCSPVLELLLPCGGNSSFWGWSWAPMAVSFFQTCLFTSIRKCWYHSVTQMMDCEDSLLRLHLLYNSSTQSSTTSCDSYALLLSQWSLLCQKASKWDLPPFFGFLETSNCTLETSNKCEFEYCFLTFIFLLQCFD